MKKIKNPLIRRIPKELIGDWKKYLVVFLFLVLTIGFVSGMYVANESMITSANEGVTKYKQEDGHFELKKQADATLLSAIETGEKADVKQYYLDEPKKYRITQYQIAVSKNDSLLYLKVHISNSKLAYYQSYYARYVGEIPYKH